MEFSELKTPLQFIFENLTFDQKRFLKYVMKKIEDSNGFVTIPYIKTNGSKDEEFPYAKFFDTGPVIRIFLLLGWQVEDAYNGFSFRCV
jgi:hypothetical protein